MAYIHRDDRGSLPDLVEAALIHYQFEAIHPFADGNGRVGRMLITLDLCMRNAIRQPLLYLSPAFERRKDEYIDRLYEVSRYGRWNEWVRFFLGVVSDASEATIATADALLKLQRGYRGRLAEAGRSANLHRLLDRLFLQQVVSISMTAEFLGVTYRSTQLNVEALTRIGILEEVEGTANPRYFIARGIRDIINEIPTHDARSSG